MSQNSSQQLSQLPKFLLQWYDENARKLPWRENPTPYRVWVSEIMLQQTRVEAVKPYFDRFVAELPNMNALAQVPEEKLLKLWEGLGYYNRVRNLQKAAQQVMQSYHGELPNDYEKLIALPGIGSYTAGAIASIAYQIPVPAVDGNVLRVLSRVMASREDITKPQVKKNMEQMISLIMPKNRAGDFNQSLMELGAMICLPNGIAKCEECPLRTICKAYEQNIVMELPIKKPKPMRKAEKRTVLVVLMNDKIALHQREKTGLLSGMWELPNFEGTLTKQKICEMIKQMGFCVKKVESLPKAKHIFSHIEWQMSGYAVTVTQEKENCQWVWVSEQDIQQNYALPTAFQVYKKEAICRIRK